MTQRVNNKDLWFKIKLRKIRIILKYKDTNQDALKDTLQYIH